METTQVNEPQSTTNTDKSRPHPTQNSNSANWIVGGGILLLFSLLMGIFGGVLGTRLAESSDSARRTVVENTAEDLKVIDQSSSVIEVAETASPSVVSVVITKNLPVYENEFYSPFGDDSLSIPRRRQVGTQQQQVGAGTGFIINEDGLIITNRHVVSDTSANYTVVLNDNRKFAAKVLARDTVLDIAVLDIEEDVEGLQALNLGDSDKIQIGQTAISIGNSLGRFSNTVSAGIVSGLERTITASSRDGLDAQQLEGVIQTDASINPGNSGGPLLDVAGNVIGVNVAIAQDAENVGFAIPINFVKPVIDSVIEFGEIRRPYLGVVYQQVTPEFAEELELPVEYGALVKNNSGQAAVLPNSPAAKADVKNGDLIYSVNGVNLTARTSLQREIQKYRIGDTVTLEVYRGGERIVIAVTLEQNKN